MRCCISQILSGSKKLETRNASQYIWEILKGVLEDLLGTKFGISHCGFPVLF